MKESVGNIRRKKRVHRDKVCNVPKYFTILILLKTTSIYICEVTEIWK